MANIIYACVCPSCAAIKGVMGDENGNLTSNNPFCSKCGVRFINTKVPVLEYARMENDKRNIWEAEIREKYAPSYKQRLEQEQTTALEEPSVQEHPFKNALKKILLLFLYFFFHGLASSDNEDDEEHFVTLDSSNYCGHSHRNRAGNSSSIRFSHGGSVHKHNGSSSGNFSSGGGSRGGGAGRRK
ncbi:hypothetical protein [uncultured Neglectibacter sp.]|uniref:hypothetical protein n=1 Tax=uncultured Neglectibacter sp. TaxID=1924108 RepID=UPI0034DEA9C4